MTPQEEHWRQRFLDAYANHTGDARRLALNDAWFAFVSSDDYHNLALTEISGFAHGHYSYWTALVDAAHVEQEQAHEPLKNYRPVVRHMAKEEMRELGVPEPTANVGIMVLAVGIGGGGGLPGPAYAATGDSGGPTMRRYLGQVFPSGYDFPFPRPDQEEPPLDAPKDTLRERSWLLNEAFPLYVVKNEAEANDPLDRIEPKLPREEDESRWDLYRGTPDEDGWQPIDTAPHDGVPIGALRYRGTGGRSWIGVAVWRTVHFWRARPSDLRRSNRGGARRDWLDVPQGRQAGAHADALASTGMGGRLTMSDLAPWQRAAQAAERFGEALIRLKAACGPDGYTFAAETAGVEIIPGTLRVRRSIWLRRPKSKKRRQWKKWQRLHAGKYLRVVDLTQGN